MEFYSSFLFATVVIHCHFAQIAAVHHMYLFLILLNHTKYCDPFHQSLAHSMAALISSQMLAPNLCDTNFWMPLATVVLTPYIQTDSIIHAPLRLIATVCTHWAIVDYSQPVQLVS